jgi:glycosyltransferase involved in cell wall biosynthesis
MADLDVSVVVPVYRSEGSVRPLVARLLRVLAATGLSHEIVLVEDGGGDGSWDVLCELQAADPDRIVAIQLMRNYGQHNALMCGFRSTRGRYIVTIDDDLQNPPEEVTKLLAAMQTGRFDLVYGTYPSKKHSLWRNAGSALVSTFYRVVFNSAVTISSFRAIDRPLLESIFPYDLNFTFIDGLLAWNTQRIGQVEVEHQPRAAGRSGYNPRKLIHLAFNLFTNFSLVPLQLVSWLGLALAGTGFVLVVFYLIQALRAQITVPGYASTIIAILVVGGAQLLALGIIGEYLGRLHLNVNRKPQYTVRTVRRIDHGATEGSQPVSCEETDRRGTGAARLRFDAPGRGDGAGNPAPGAHRHPASRQESRS